MAVETKGPSKITYFLVYQPTRPMKGAGTTSPGTEEPVVQHLLPCAITALLWGSALDESNAQGSNKSPHKSSPPPCIPLCCPRPSATYVLLQSSRVCAEQTL